MTVLVTGGCGFIGSHLVEALLAAGTPVRVLDDLSTGRRENLAAVAADVELIVGDLRDEPTCERACQGVEVVYHQAAVPSVPRSVEEPLRTFEVNVLGTHRLLLAARAAGVRRLVLASSSSVYGDAPALPKHEDLPCRPLSPYAAHKASCEQLARAFAKSLGLEAVALRYFNVYGPRQDPSSRYAAVVAAFASALLDGRPARIHGDGEQTRDFTFVEDVVRANLAAASAEGASGGVFNISGGLRTSVNSLHQTLARVAGVPAAPPEHLSPRAGDVRDSLADISRAADVLSWSPQVDLEDGLARTLSALREARG